jgi:hypothetical protein
MLIGAKSFTESYGSFEYTAGLMAKADIGPSNRVYPFAALFATSSRATMPLPPERLSMTICCRNCSVSLGPIMRA